MSTSSDSAESTPLGESAARVSTSIIHQRVADLAHGAMDRSEFLKLLAADLCASFHAAVVAIDSSHWGRPMMLVVDEVLTQQLQREVIRDQLGSATEMPIASDLPINDSNGTDAVRGIRVQLTAAPHRAAAPVDLSQGIASRTVSPNRRPEAVECLCRGGAKHHDALARGSRRGPVQS